MYLQKVISRKTFNSVLRIWIPESGALLTLNLEWKNPDPVFKINILHPATLHYSGKDLDTWIHPLSQDK